MKTTQELIEIASEIQAENNGSLLSGSLGLNMLGFKTAREPNDIDIYIPYGFKFKPVNGLYFSPNVTEQDYEDDLYERTHYRYKGVKIDVFTPFEKHDDINSPDEFDSNVLCHRHILGLKCRFALMASGNPDKHKDDVIFFLNNN